MGKYTMEYLSEILALDNPNEHEDQRVRQRNAKKCVMTSFDKDTETAEFKGSGKKLYIATPDSCTCQDFGMRKLPCKHIYRLMHELGRFDLNSVPEGRVSEIKGGQPDFDISLLEGLSINAMEELYALLCEWICSFTGNEWLFDKNEPVSTELLQHHILEEAALDISPIILTRHSYDELRKVLRAKGITVKSKKEALEKILVDTQDFISMEKSKYRLLKFNDKLTSDRALIAKYLRKTVIYPNNPELHKVKLFWNELPQIKNNIPFNPDILIRDPL